MRYTLRALIRNLVAGARTTLFLRVDRSAFRIEVLQWILVIAVSVLLDVVLDWLRADPGSVWSWSGANGELFWVGSVMLAASIVAGAARDRSLFLALPLIVFAPVP